jgi:hypothetical protein
MTMIKSYAHFSFNFSSFSRRQTQRVFTSLFLLFLRYTFDAHVDINDINDNNNNNNNS